MNSGAPLRRLSGFSTKAALVVSVLGAIVVLGACSTSDDDSTNSSSTTSSPDDSTPGSPVPSESTQPASSPVVGTAQTDCYDDSVRIECPTDGEAFFGQDGNWTSNTPSYTDNGDGTVTDDVTGLMWQQDPGAKTSYADAVAGAASFDLAGYDDWRLPTIKELYSLIEFTGIDPSSLQGNDTLGVTPFIDTEAFAFSYGDTTEGERVIDAQWTTSTVYGSTVFGDQECFFGVNFADGRIKCYPTHERGSFFTFYVRGDAGYGTNDLTDNGDGTVTDRSTGLMWQQGDSAQGLDWAAALSYCTNSELAGHDDWRLPDTKSLQGIVDYSRAPDTTDSAAIDPVFDTTSITNEAGETDYPSYWSSTTHLSYPDNASSAAYVSFGRSLGYIDGRWIDVHGAGSQRSDPKAGDASEFPTGRGPQGDAIRIENHVRCVRGDAEPTG